MFKRFCKFHSDIHLIRPLFCLYQSQTVIYFFWNLLFNTAIAAAAPVSYTHLDVYKRQDYIISVADAVALSHCLTGKAFLEEGDEYYADINNDGAVDAFDPVSYTHLVGPLGITTSEPRLINITKASDSAENSEIFFPIHLLPVCIFCSAN